MKISHIYINNFRCFDKASMAIGNMTVLIGQNNSGKSSLLRAISLMQAGSSVNLGDIRAGAGKAEITFNCDYLTSFAPLLPGQSRDGRRLNISFERPSNSLLLFNEFAVQLNQCSAEEPDNCIVPYYSKRKIHGLTEDVRGQYARGAFNMNYLASKLSRITVPTFPGHREYVEACENILGFTLGAIPSDNGLRPGRYLSDGSALTLEQMGDGVPSIVALLIELVTARNKIFLIEEPENDLHPNALKSLLEVILSSAKHNQFIVSTHSNIVLQYLGGTQGSIYEISPISAEFPTSSVLQVAEGSSARTAVLRKLGYTLSDFDLWDGWIILEESSAERIIRDFLVPLFAPRLTSIRLLAANGVDDAEATYSALHRMVRFTHLEETYRFTTWVRLDGDAAGQKIIKQLRDTYKQAHQDQFAVFAAENFEYYYPVGFRERVVNALAISDRQARRAAKQELLHEVIAWLREDEARAQKSLAESAAEVIEFLRAVESTLS